MEKISSDEELYFQDRIDRGEKIEVHDWMPDGYRKTLIRQITQHANSEYVGMLPESNWLAKAPSLNRKAILLAKVQDEAGHAQYLYSVLEGLGVSRADLYDDLYSGRSKYLNIFNYPAMTWADVGMIGWLTDGAAIINQVPLSECSYGPYARAMKRICQEESFHNRQGFELVLELIKSGSKGKAQAQNALNRWWWPTIMVFGPPDDKSIHSANSMKWKIKLFTNDTLRQKFVDQTVPQIEYLGLKVPDSECIFDPKRGQYTIGKINWDEFNSVLKGNGLCNASRLTAREKAWKTNSWVREAATYAQINKFEVGV